MVRLHDRTRRLLCLLGFVVFCLSPTALVVGWSAARGLPGNAAAEARRLSAALGLPVSIEGIQWLQPGVVRYLGFVVDDPKSNQPLLRCAAVTARRTRDADGAEGLLFETESAELAAVGLPRLQRLVQRQLQSEGSVYNVTWRVGRLDWIDAQYPLSADRVRGGIRSVAEGAQAWIEFFLAGQEAAEPIRAQWVRDRRSEPPALGLELNTHGAALPCGLVAAVAGDLQRLGSAAFFNGSIAGRSTPAGWTGELRGRFTKVDLASLWPGGVLQGNGELVVDRMTMQAGRIDQVALALRVGQGTIDRSLAERLVRCLYLTPVGDFGSRQGALPFEQLALSAELGPDGLRLAGQCENAAAGTILVDRYGAGLAQPVSQPLPVASLLLAVAPHTVSFIPASEQIADLVRWLPISRGAASDRATDEASPPAPPSTPTAHSTSEDPDETPLFTPAATAAQPRPWSQTR